MLGTVRPKIVFRSIEGKYYDRLWKAREADDLTKLEALGISPEFLSQYEPRCLVYRLAKRFDL